MATQDRRGTSRDGRGASRLTATLVVLATFYGINHVNGGHGMPRTTEDEGRDDHRRILDGYARWLEGPGDDAGGAAGGVDGRR